MVDGEMSYQEVSNLHCIDGIGDCLFTNCQYFLWSVDLQKAIVACNGSLYLGMLLSDDISNLLPYLSNIYFLYLFILHHLENRTRPVSARHDGRNW